MKWKSYINPKYSFKDYQDRLHCWRNNHISWTYLPVLEAVVSKTIPTTDSLQFHSSKRAIVASAIRSPAHLEDLRTGTPSNFLPPMPERRIWRRSSVEAPSNVSINFPSHWTKAVSGGVQVLLIFSTMVLCTSTLYLYAVVKCKWTAKGKPLHAVINEWQIVLAAVG